MDKPNIVAMLRLKNEERWIEKTLQALSDICRGIVILDDGSTDNTLQICKIFNKVVDIHQQSNLPYDETRDRNTLFNMALKQKPDFILNTDGDEIIPLGTKEILFEELNVLYPDTHVFEFQSLFIWDKPDQYRYDGDYSNIWHKMLIRIRDQPNNLVFSNTKFPGNAHSSRIPDNAVGLDKPVKSKVKIFHYGYYDKALRQNKFNFYNKLDPDNKVFDGYKYIISEDGRFSGSNGIEIRLLPKDMVIEI